jgi:type VI protein secretion system component Hcp
MTKSSKRHLVLAVTAAFVLLAPGIAFAGGKGGGGKQAGSDRPTENLSLNYGKVEHTYAQKNKASPSLLKNVNTGKHINKTSN